MLKAGGKTTFYNAIQKDIKFFYERPTIAYQHITDFYHLGTVIPMTTKNSGLPVSINDIPLTEGDFNGACFSDYSIRLYSGNKDIGWIMHIKNDDNTINTYYFDTTLISIIPKEYQHSEDSHITSIDFETYETSTLSNLKIIHQQSNRDVNTIYTIDGTRYSGNARKPRIIRYSDGQSIKVW